TAGRAERLGPPACVPAPAGGRTAAGTDGPPPVCRPAPARETGAAGSRKGRPAPPGRAPAGGRPGPENLASTRRERLWAEPESVTVLVRDKHRGMPSASA